MRKAILLILTLNMTVLFLTGCGDPYAPVKKLFKPSADTDVTSSPRYNFSSFAGTVWKTKVRTAIAEGKRYTGAPETRLLAPHRFDPTEPNYNDPHNTKILTVMPVGTRLRIQRLMQDNGAWGGVQVTATVEDGTNGQWTVFLDSVLLASNYYLAYEVGKTNWSVNLEMLAPDLDSGQTPQSAPETGDAPQAGYEKGYGKGKKRAIEAPNYPLGYLFSDPWLGGGEQRLKAVKLHGEDYVAAYESGYNKGFHDNSQKSAKGTNAYTNSGVNPEKSEPVTNGLKK